MLDLHIIASGSSGNAYCIETDSKYIFIDIGTTRKSVEQLLPIRESEKEIQLFLTHEHHDHICGYKPFMNRYQPQVFCTEGTAAAMDANGLNVQQVYMLDSCQIYDMDGMDVTPFSVHHDCADPVGYRFDIDGKVITCATDLGMADDLVLDYLSGSDLLILESNYEEELLKNGKYPPHLKKRISSGKGHLSNKAALNVLASLADTGIGQTILSHVSEENNDYALLQKYADFAKEHYDIDTRVVEQGQQIKGIKI